MRSALPSKSDGNRQSASREPSLLPLGNDFTSWEHENKLWDLSRTDPAKALALAEKCIQSSGLVEETARARRVRAIALRVLGRYEESCGDFVRCKLDFQAAGLELEDHRTNSAYIFTLRYLGRYAEAIALGLESIPLFEAHQDYIECGRLFLNLGPVYRRTGQLTQALDSYNRATEYFERISDRPYIAMTSMNLGNLLGDMGEFEQAVSAIERALEIRRELRLPADVALALMNLGRIRTLRGEFGGAVTVLRESRRTYSRLKRRYEVALVDLDLAKAYLALNLRPEARRACRSAVSAFESLNMPYELGQALLADSSLLLEDRRPKRAIGRAYRARKIFSDIGNRFWLQVAVVQVAQIGLQMRRGPSPESLLSEIQTARSELSELGAREWEGFTYIAEAEAQQRLRRYDASQRALECALEIGELIHSDAIVLQSHWALGRLPELHPDDALDHFRAAADSVERMRVHSRSTDLKVSFLRDKSALYDAALGMLLGRQPHDLPLMFEFIERSRARSLADSSADQSAVESDDPTEHKLRSRIADLRGQSQKLYEQAYGMGASKESTENVDARSELERLERATDRLHQDLFLLRPSIENSPLSTLADLQSTLSRCQAALVYFEAGHSIHALVVTSNAATLAANLADTRLVTRLARRIQFHVGKAAYGADYMRQQIDTLRDGLDEHLKALGKLLFDPILNQLSSFRELVVLPSTSAYGLPFHAFIVNERRYAAEQFAVQYAPSATVRMVNRRRKEPNQGAPVLVGISDKSLPGVGREVKQLSDLLSAAIVLADDRATIGEFRAHAPKASAIHLATHGVFREDNPAYSGIKFADGWMTAADLADICRDTSLITLSACETGMGSDLGGGEIMGISQAILGSGCASLTSSLWTADDAGTVDLMTDFYGELKRGKSAPQAMRTAMLSARQRDDHPYFWAPFAVFGEGKLPTC